MGLTTDEEGNIYYIDTDLHQLIALDAKGNLKWRTGQQGRGPGDFEKPRGLATDGRYLYTVNISGTRIDRFSTKGTYVDSYDLGKKYHFPRVEGVTDSGYLVLSQPLWEAGKFGEKVIIINLPVAKGSGRTETGRDSVSEILGSSDSEYVLAGKAGRDSMSVVHTFELDQSNGLKPPYGVNSSSGIRVYGSKILAGSITDYSFKIYNLKGELLKRVERKFDKIRGPCFSSDGNSRSIGCEEKVAPPIILPGGYYLVLAFWHISDTPYTREDFDSYSYYRDKVTRSSLDLFDPGGRLLYSQEQKGTSPEMGVISHIGPGRYAYMVTGYPELKINKYRVIIEK